MGTKKAGRGGSDKSELVFVALGGLGEIGMNVYLYGLGPPDERQWLMVDLGLTFPGPAEPGVDVVLPDLRFIESQKGSLVGIVLTHAHEDHLGAVIDLWPRLEAPVYATPFTAGMLKSKVGDFGGALKLPLTEVALGSRFNVGPFDIELVTMAHSIPEPCGLVIRTEHGTAFHSGDWKLDYEPLVGDAPDTEQLKALGDEGVHALVCDSTNALREGSSPSETEIANSLAEIIKKAPNRVAVTTFASNVARIKAVADAAHAAGRHLIVAGRSLHRVIGVAMDTGYLPDSFRYLDQDQFDTLERNKVVVLVTGSQGEGRAALSRIGEDSHPDISLAKGDLVIFSSRNIPGNEKSIGLVQNNLVRLGCEVITDNEALVHVTGHPRRDELRQMYEWLRPKVAIPMHGEARHLKAHAKLALGFGAGHAHPVLNGEMVKLAPGRSGLIDEAPSGRLYRDGRIIVDSGEGPVRERRKLSQVGVVFVSIAIDRVGRVVAEPMAVLDGVPSLTRDGDEMLDIVLDAIDGTLASIPVKRRRDPDKIADSVRRAVRAEVASEWGKRPIAKVLVNVVED